MLAARRPGKAAVATDTHRMVPPCPSCYRAGSPPAHTRLQAIHSQRGHERGCQLEQGGDWQGQVGVAGTLGVGIDEGVSHCAEVQLRQLYQQVV